MRLRPTALGLALASVSAAGLADEPVVVRATDTPSGTTRGGRDETAASSALGERELARAGATVADALRTQPGVSVVASGSGADLSTALVRGASSAELPVYLAGIRINDDIGGTTDLSTVPVWLLRRVEIYRGNAPADADRPGIAGAIFLDPRMPRRTQAGVSLGAGSYGWRSLSATGGVAGEGASALVAIRRENSDNDWPYADDRGAVLAGAAPRTVRRVNADARTTDVWAIARGGGDAASWTAVLEGFRREQGIAGTGLTPNRLARATTTRSIAGVRGNLACGEGCTASVGTSMLSTETVLQDPAGELGAGASQVASRGTRIEPSARLRFHPVDAVRLGLASDVAREMLRTEPAGGTTSEARRTFARGAADVAVTPDDLLLLAGLLSVERNATSVDGTGALSVAPVSARASARVGSERLAGLANVGRYVRVPTLGELYGRSPTVGGNVALLPERGTTVDAGVRASTATGQAWGLALDAFAFARSVDDLVAYRRANFGLVRPYNVASAHVRGAEVALAATGFSRLRLDEALTLLDARDDATERQLPLRPRLVSATRVSVSLGDLVGTRGADAGVTVVRQASRYADQAGLEVLPHQTTVDVDASVEVSYGPGQITVRGRITNVTDGARFDVVGYPLPPRQGFVTIEATLE